MKPLHWTVGVLIALSLVLVVGWHRERQVVAFAQSEIRELKEQLVERSQPQAAAADSPPPVHVENALTNAIPVSKKAPAPNAASEIVKQPDSSSPTNLPTTDSAITGPVAKSVSATNVAPAEIETYTQTQLDTYRCANQMFAISMAAEKWAAEHDGRIPYDLKELRGYIAPMLLVCPGSRPRSLAVSWELFNIDDISYRRLPIDLGVGWGFGIRGASSPLTKKWLECPIHRTWTFNEKMTGVMPLAQFYYPR